METGRFHYFLSLQISTVSTFLSGLCLQEDSKLDPPQNLTNFRVMHQEPIVVYQKIKEMRASTIMQKSQELARLRDPEEDTQDIDTINETWQDECTTPTSSGESKLLCVCNTSHI
jgi:hypothetical protein